MAQPPPVQRPLQVRAQDVLANVQAAPAVSVPQQGPQAVPAVPAHVAAPDNEAVFNADNANQNPAPPAAPEPAPWTPGVVLLIRTVVLALLCAIFAVPARIY